MKIAFNLLNTGLGNNGGSSTIIKSANALIELGHDVSIIDSGKNRHTWTPLLAKHIIIKDIKDVPESDIIIATGIKSVDSMDLLKAKNKVWWIRGYETWNLPEEGIINKIKSSNTIKIVNSICLQKKLDSFGVYSTIMRPGYDLNELTPTDSRDRRVSYLGGIYNEGKKRKDKRTEWIFDAYRSVKSKYNIMLMMYGSDGVPTYGVTQFFKNPKPEEKNKIYNNIDIWLAPSKLEGLHIPPAEAMLTECPVITTNAEMSGTQDYIINNETGLVSEDNIEDFKSKLEFLINSKEERLKLGKNGREAILKIGDRKSNMLKMVEFFEGII